MIRLATGITPNYLPRARPYLGSLSICNVDTSVFAVNFMACDEKKLYGIRAIPVDYALASLPLPKFMLQTGGFTQFAPSDWADDDVVIFTDSDAILQRPFTPKELEEFANWPEMTFGAAYNLPNVPQTLLDESTRIFPKVGPAIINERLPGLAAMTCLNFGFVVARLSAWRILLSETIKLWPTVNACFDNPARVQFCALYAIQRSVGLKLVELSPLLHAHGHCGLRNGVARGEDGLWRQDGEVVAFAHAL